MSWNWHWWLFLIALVACTILVQFARGALNAHNVAKYGLRAEYKADPLRAILGSVIAGGIYAAILTAIAGFIF